MRLRGMEAVAPDAVRRGLHLAQGCARAVRFVPTKLEGAYVVEPERHEDERGFFARTWSGDEFAEHGLVSELSQCSISRNSKAGTLRGMHFQTAPHEEAKLVRCTRRRDLRRDRRPEAGVRRRSRDWVGVELDAETGQRALHPEGVRARVPDARRRRRGLLHDLRLPTSPRQRRACAGTTRRSESTGLRRDSRDHQRARPVVAGLPARESAHPRRVEVVAPDLVDLGEQHVDLVQRVQEPAAQLVGVAACEACDQLSRLLGVDDASAADLG